jgi:hypothetical protein
LSTATTISDASKIASGRSRQGAKRKEDALYRRCEHCGASLDPCEICDCKKEAAPELTLPEAAKEKYPIRVYQLKGEKSNAKFYIPIGHRGF